MRHIFIWQLPLDFRLPEFLGRAFGEYHFYGLAYSAQCALRLVYGDPEAKSARGLIGAAANRDLLRHAVDCADRFYAAAERRNFKTIMARESDWIFQPIYYVAYFRALCRRMREEYGVGTYEQYPFFFRSGVHGSWLRIQQYLGMVLDEFNGYSQTGKRDVVDMVYARLMAQSWARHLTDAAGKIRTAEDQSHHGNEVDVLFLAMEESDRRSQSPLVERFLKHENLSIKWCCVQGSRMHVSTDERAFERVQDVEETIHALPQDMSGLYRWRFNWQAKQIDWMTRFQINTCLNEAGLDDWSPLLRWRLSGMLCEGSSKLPLLKKAAGDLLDWYKPKVLVMSSSYGAMRAAQAAAEDRGVPLVRLPHGVEHTTNPEINWRGQSVGRFGRADMESLLRRHPTKSESIKPIGGYHLAAQAIADASNESVKWADGQIQIIYPVSYGLLFYPDTPSDIEIDLLAMGSAARHVGAKLSVRCHPRQRAWDYYDYVAMKWHHGERADWELSDGSDSLVEAMRSSHIMVIRTWAGASLQALYAHRPLVAWMPRYGYDYADEILSKFPSRATNQQELEHEFRRLIDDEDYRAAVLDGQRQLLDYVVKDPYGDPYAGAEGLVLDALREA